MERPERRTGIKFAVLRGTEVVGVAFEQSEGPVPLWGSGNDNLWVSTIFLGVDHSHGFGRPLWFETMVFRDGEAAECVRYASYQEAERGHQAMAKQVFPALAQSAENG
jgi:hypothetical protein